MLVALAVDRWLGEPPTRWHPVVWMGRYLDWVGAWVQRHTQQGQQSDPSAHGRAAPAPPDYKAFWLSALVWCAGAALVLIAAMVLQSAVAYLLAGALQGGQPVQGAQAVKIVHALPVVPLTRGAQVDWVAPMQRATQVEPWGQFSWGVSAGQGVWMAWGKVALAALLLGALLKPMLAWSMLKNEVLAVDKALDPAQGGSLAAGRERLRWLVSRDVTALSECQVRESAIETLAENLNDSVVAPLFWFVLLGLPGAALFRFANTADAMWGYPGIYQGRNWEWAGKWAARADDVLGWLPAHITGVVLLLVAHRLTGLRQLCREAAQTPSPNSGWPMAAMALGLDVALRKPGGYTLNAQARTPLAKDTDRAIFYASKTLFALVGFAQAAIISIALWG